MVPDRTTGRAAPAGAGGDYSRLVQFTGQQKMLSCKITSMQANYLTCAMYLCRCDKAAQTSCLGHVLPDKINECKQVGEDTAVAYFV
jgi:hypothetical protein